MLSIASYSRYEFPLGTPVPVEGSGGASPRPPASPSLVLQDLSQLHDEDDGSCGDDADAGNNGDGRGVMLEGQFYVHAVKAGDEGGDHDDDGQRGENLHDLVDAV